MVRNFLIWQDGNEWEIRESGLETYQNAKSLDIGVFGISKQKDKKIIYLMGIVLLNEEIEAIKEIEAFKEVCKFTYNETWFTQNKIQPNGHSFTGNFIEALEFLQNKFNEDYEKSLDDRLKLYKEDRK